MRERVKQEISVTRFDKNLPLGQNFKRLCPFWGFILNLANFLTFFDKSIMRLGQFSWLQMAQYWANNLAIWSHWKGFTRWTISFKTLSASFSPWLKQSLKERERKWWSSTLSQKFIGIQNTIQTSQCINLFLFRGILPASNRMGFNSSPISQNRICTCSIRSLWHRNR